MFNEGTNGPIMGELLDIFPDAYNPFYDCSIQAANKKSA